MIAIVARILRALAVLLPTLFVAGAVAVLYFFIPAPRLDDSLELEALTQAYEALDVSAPDHETMVIGLTREFEAPASAVWARWTRLEDWPSWHANCQKAVWQQSVGGWDRGAVFVRERAMGFPLGTLVTTDQVQRSSPGRSVLWTSRQRGLRIAQSWLFEDIGGGRSRVTTVEVMQGWKVALLKPIVTRRWQDDAERSMAGLAAAMRPANASPPISSLDPEP